MKKKKPAPSVWFPLFGSLTCLMAVLLPLFPDEKLVRLKLEVFELSIFVLVVLAGIFFILQKEWTHEPHREDKVFLFTLHLWLIVNAVLFFFSPEKSLAVMEMRRVSLAYGTFMAFRWGPLNETWRDRFFLSWSLASGVLCLYGLMQWNGGIGPVQVPQMSRIMGTFGNPIFFAAYLLAGFYFTRQAIHRYKNETWSILLLAVLVLHVAALVLAKTRAAWIALAFLLVVEIFFLFQSKKKAFLWGLGLLLVGFVFIVFTQDIWKRDQGHLLIWRDTLRMAFQNPWLGVGLGAFHVRFPEFAQADLISKWPKGQFIVNYAHNEYVQMFSEGGILLVLSFLAMLGAFGWLLWNRRADRMPHRAILLAGSALLIQNFFSVDMRFSFSFAFVFLVMGLLSRRPDEAADEKIPPSLFSFVAIGIWVGVLFGLVLPLLLKPYLAHRAFSKQVDFFDERVLDPSKTIAEIKALSEKYPNEPAILERLAYLYAKEMKDPQGNVNWDMTQKAVSTYEKLIEVRPDNVAAYNNMANVFYTVGRVDDAIANWKKAVEIDPDFIDVHLNLGKILYVRGELKDAATHLQEVLKRQPDNAEAQIYLKKMVE